MSNPYVFIVGCARSGTTLLQHVLDAHPRIAVMPQAHWIYGLGKHYTGMRPERTVKEDIVPALLKDPEFADLGITGDQLLTLMREDQHPAYLTFVRRVFDLYGKREDKELVGNKTPGLVRRLESVHELWPEARVVHIIRDGRDVFLSMKNRPLRRRLSRVRVGPTEDPVARIGLWWELSVQMGRNAGKMLGPRLYHEVPYETFVTRPTEACAQLCTFLEIPFSEAMLKFYEKGKTPETSRPITPGLRDWRSEMAPEDAEVFESAAGRLLEDLGYPRAFPHPSREFEERSAQMRSLLQSRSPRYARAFDGAERAND
jgi:sulfotransferase family protein